MVEISTYSTHLIIHQITTKHHLNFGTDMTLNIFAHQFRLLITYLTFPSIFSPNSIPSLPS